MINDFLPRSAWKAHFSWAPCLCLSPLQTWLNIINKLTLPMSEYLTSTVLINYLEYVVFEKGAFLKRLKKKL